MATEDSRMRRFYPWLFDKMRDCSAEFAPDVEGVQVSSDLDEFGRELPDAIPLAPPVGMSSGPSLADFVQRMIRNEVSRAAAMEEAETFEEADDFDTGEDDLDPLTDYEAQFDPRYQKVWKALQEQEEAVAAAMKGGGGGDKPPTDKAIQEPRRGSQDPPPKEPGPTGKPSDKTGTDSST